MWWPCFCLSVVAHWEQTWLIGSDTDCEAAVLGSKPAISPAWIGLKVLRWAAIWDDTSLLAVFWGAVEENINNRDFYFTKTKEKRKEMFLSVSGSESLLIVIFYFMFVFMFMFMHLWLFTTLCTLQLQICKILIQCKSFGGNTVCQVMPARPDNAHSNVVKSLKPVLCSSHYTVPLKYTTNLYLNITFQYFSSEPGSDPSTVSSR